MLSSILHIASYAALEGPYQPNTIFLHAPISSNSCGRFYSACVCVVKYVLNARMNTACFHMCVIVDRIPDSCTYHCCSLSCEQMRYDKYIWLFAYWSSGFTRGRHIGGGAADLAPPPAFVSTSPVQPQPGFVTPLLTYSVAAFIYLRDSSRNYHRSTGCRHCTPPLTQRMLEA
jgi:hypothetical protein